MTGKPMTPTTCPHCGKVNMYDDMATSAQPSDGDLSICIDCGAFGVFDAKAEGGMRRCNLSELIEIAHNAEAQHAKRAWQAMDKQRTRQ